jgi:hypothetical protein
VAILAAGADASVSSGDWDREQLDSVVSVNKSSDRCKIFELQNIEISPVKRV